MCANVSGVSSVDTDFCSLRSLNGIGPANTDFCLLGPLGGDVFADSACNELCFPLLHYTAYSPITGHVTVHRLHDTPNKSIPS
jgi:hypothetical protein